MTVVLFQHESFTVEGSYESIYHKDIAAKFIITVMKLSLKVIHLRQRGGGGRAMKGHISIDLGPSLLSRFLI